MGAGQNERLKHCCHDIRVFQNKIMDSKKFINKDLCLYP